MCEGEYKSLKAIHTISPGFTLEPHAWGRYGDEELGAWFLLEEFRDIGEQLAGYDSLPSRLADLHHRSISPTGGFGFHTKTCHSRIIQEVDKWDNSWATVFGRHLRHFLDLAKSRFNSPEFDAVGELTMEKVVPRLLLPLQEDGRILKPCLIHGDCWDGNTATDPQTGEAFVFDACCFYGHNEYDIGDWRPPRHQLSMERYVDNYKKSFPASEPVEDWNARNILYSLPFNIGNALYIPGSQQRQVVHDDMLTLCQMFCPDDLTTAVAKTDMAKQIL